MKMMNATVAVLLPYQISTPLPDTALKIPPITPTKTAMDKKSCRKCRKIMFMRFAPTKNCPLPKTKVGDGVKCAPLLVPVEEEEGKGEGEPDADKAQLFDSRGQHTVKHLRL